MARVELAPFPFCFPFPFSFPFPFLFAFPAVAALKRRPPESIAQAFPSPTLAQKTRKDGAATFVFLPFPEFLQGWGSLVCGPSRQTNPWWNLHPTPEI
jgi:hypothetical protein